MPSVRSVTIRAICPVRASRARGTSRTLRAPKVRLEDGDRRALVLRSRGRKIELRVGRPAPYVDTPGSKVRALVVVAPRDLEPDGNLRVADRGLGGLCDVSANHASDTNETYSIAPSFADVGSMVISIMFPLVIGFELRAIGAMSPDVVDVVSVPSLGTRERAATTTSARWQLPSHARWPSS